MEYFISFCDPDSDLATRISAIDLDSSEIMELVTPERKYALAGLNWSPDGHFMAFSETISMESGMFAYFDPENQEYVSWNESVGSASGSPDGNPLTYDRWI